MDTKQRNVLQASEIIFILAEKKCLPPSPQKYYGPPLTITVQQLLGDKLHLTLLSVTHLVEHHQEED